MEFITNLKALARLLSTGNKDDFELAKNIADGLDDDSQYLWGLWRHLVVYPQRTWRDYIFFELENDQRPDTFYVLRLKRQNIKNLPEAFFVLPSLHILELNDNDIRHLPQQINNFSDLRRLDLSRCQLRSLPSLRLPQLAELHISNNPIRLINDNFFAHLPYLRIFSLQYTRLQQLPESLWQVPKLLELRAHGSRIQAWSLPEKPACAQLRTVDLSNNSLASLPADLSVLANLSRLDLSRNQLQTFAEHTGNKIYILRLQHNALTYFCGSMALSARLGHLQIANNQLNTLDWLFVPYGLRTLHLQRNRLRQLPELLGSAPLTSLLLHDNQLESLPKSVAGWHRLRQLNLYKNKIKKLPNYLATQLPKLQRISLAANELREIPKPIFNCVQLVKLDLSHNQISQIPTAIAQLSQLQMLILRNNNLSELPPQFYALQQLKLLDLRGNPQLSAAQIADCRQQLPHCFILA